MSLFSKTALLALFLATSAAAQFVPPGHMIIEGDIIVPNDFYTTDGGFDGISWTNGVVPYDFDFNVSATNQTAARVAMAELEAVANLSFVPRTNQTDWIRFFTATGNSSFVGRVGGMQPINIVSWGARHIICHELMHALGMIHEQSRPDRDSFVTINFLNICPGRENNFYTHPLAQTSGAYDFDSVMHYSEFAFSICTPGECQTNPPACNATTRTITTADPGMQATIGQRSHLSLLDAAALVSRYGAPPAPTVTSISPSSITTGGPFVITIDGTRFFRGSQDGGGVLGTRVRLGPFELPVAFVSSTRILATIDPLTLTFLGQITLWVENPAPGGGMSNAVSLTVTCGGAVMTLVNGVAQSVTNACQSFSFTPQTGEWNVVGVAAATDWHVEIGGVSSANFVDNTELLLANGRLGTVTPATGFLTRQAGTSTARAMFNDADTLVVNDALDTSLSADVPFRALEFNVTTAGQHVVTVTGDASLRWRLYDPGSGAGWRPRTTSVASGTVSGAPTTLSLGAGWHCLAVYKNGGAPATIASFTAAVCTTTSVVSVSSTATTIADPCTVFSVSPTAGTWNCVGVGSSSSDWDISLGQAESQVTSTATDYLVANGRLGTISPTTGVIYRESGTGTASAQATNRTTMAVGSPTNFSWPSTSLHRLIEVQILSAGSYDLAVSGPSELTCRLFAPGSDAAWRRRLDAILSSTVNTTTVFTRTLAAGWHCIVVSKDAGPGALSNFSLSVVPTPNPAPVLTSISPLTTQAGAATTILSVTGTGFVPASAVRFGSVGLPTTFVSATELQATVASSELVTAGVRTVTVVSPAPGGGTSAGLSFTITNPAPTLTSINPDQAVAGTTSVVVSLLGTGFNAQSVARFDGTAVPTSLVSSTSLTATIPSYLLPSAGTATLTVINPSPGGGTSAGRVFTITNPVPILLLVSPTSTLAGTGPLNISASGASFIAGQTVLQWNGQNLTTLVLSSSIVLATVPPALLVTPGTYQITARTGGPGGGTSAPRSFTVAAPVPTVLGVAPSSLPVGSPTTTVSVAGTGFVSASLARWNNATLVTTYVSPTELQAAVPASFLMNPAAASITVTTPSPGGGTSATFPFVVTPPVLLGVSPATIAVQTPGAPPLTLLLSGIGFLPGVSRVSADGIFLSEITSSTTALQVSLDPALVLQAQRPGGIAVTVENTKNGVSNSHPVRVGPGANEGLIRRQPLAPLLGQPYAAVIEGGTPNAVFSLYIDLANLPPVVAWPDPTANLVVAVGPVVGSFALFLPIIEGIGLFGPATGAALDGAGGFVLPGFVLPSPAVNVELTLQALYLDPAAPLGFRLSYARFPDRL